VVVIVGSFVLTGISSLSVDLVIRDLARLS
jgi:hypothetical protein